MQTTAGLQLYFWEEEKKTCVCTVQENKGIYVCTNSKGLLS